MLGSEGHSPGSHVLSRNALLQGAFSRGFGYLQTLAMDIYKRHLVSDRDLHALNYYIAASYCLLDYYDVALEVLQLYDNAYRHQSILAMNLRACCTTSLHSGKAAEEELQKSIANMRRMGVWTTAVEAGFSQSKAIRHNMVVFQDGANAKNVSLTVKGVRLVS